MPFVTASLYCKFTLQLQCEENKERSVGTSKQKERKLLEEKDKK